MSTLSSTTRSFPSAVSGWSYSARVVSPRDVAWQFLRSPVAVTALSASLVAVLWMVPAKLLPGFRGSRHDSPFLVQALIVPIWIVLYAWVATAYVRVSEGPDVRRIVERLALCFALAVPLGLVPHLTGFTSSFYHRARLASWLYLAGCCGLMAAVLLKNESRYIAREFLAVCRSFCREADRWRIQRLCASTAALVGGGELLIFLFSEEGYRQIVQTVLFNPLALAANAAILLCLVGLLFAATNRLAFSVVLVHATYVLATVVAIVKQHYLHTALQPLDVQYVTEFLPYFTSFFGIGTAVALAGSATVVVLILAAIWERSVYRAPLSARTKLAAFAVLALAATAATTWYTSTRNVLQCVGLAELRWNSELSARRNGLLMEMLFQLPTLYVPQPRGYSEETIARIVRQYGADSSGSAGPPPEREPINLVLYVVESLMDPRDLGVEFTREPIPTIRRLRDTHSGGWAVAPGFPQGSANSEFELLTGMAMHFLPQGSCPYKQYVKRPVPSLPRVLRDHDYHTVAIQTCRSTVYNYAEAYPHLGFEQFICEEQLSEAERAVHGRLPSDEAIVDAVIAASKRDNPFFVLAFPASSHAPYNYDQYVDSDLDITTPLPRAMHNELKTYVNAIHDADRALARLVKHFEQSDRKTIVVVVGDHLPPFSTPVYSKLGYLSDSDPEAFRKRYRVPLRVWANFPRPKEQFYVSFNFLAPYVLSAMGIEPAGFFAVNDAVRSRVSVLSNYVQTAGGDVYMQETVPAEFARLIHEYRLIQYDQLFGEQYLSLSAGSLSQ